MRGANLIEANLAGVDFSRADLRGAELPCGMGVAPDEPPPNFTAADLSGPEPSQCTTIGGGRLDRANFTGADLEGVSIVFESLNGADFTDANLRGVVFLNREMQEERPEGSFGPTTYVRTASTAERRAATTICCKTDDGSLCSRPFWPSPEFSWISFRNRSFRNRFCHPLRS